jgi:hypothetical protein
MNYQIRKIFFCGYRFEKAKPNGFIPVAIPKSRQRESNVFVPVAIPKSRQRESNVFVPVAIRQETMRTEMLCFVCCLNEELLVPHTSHYSAEEKKSSGLEANDPVFYFIPF